MPSPSRGRTWWVDPRMRGGGAPVESGGVHLLGRSPHARGRRAPGWFEAIRPGIRDHRPAALPVLRPAWALADMLKTEGWGRCGLWPDDIYWDEADEQDRADWPLAAEALGIPAALPDVDLEAGAPMDGDGAAGPR